MKKFFVFLSILFIVLFYFGRETADPNRKIEWGISFSQPFVQKIGLDWQKAYLEILDELKFKKIRLIAYWPAVEPEQGVFSFSDLDWQVSQAVLRDVKIILAVGRKLPRWPECYEPDWVQNQKPETKDQKLLDYIEKVINHYKDKPAIFAWEVENEPFLKFGECPSLDVKLLDKEIALVRRLDSRPVIITDSGELSIWIPAAKRADIFGTTLYQWVWHKWLGTYKYPIPPAFFRIKERVTRLFVGQQKPFIVIELQGEPWHEKQIYEMTLEEQLELLNFKEFKGLIEYAKKAGFSEYYFWGAEWWYSLKQQGHPEYWEHIKTLVN